MSDDVIPYTDLPLRGEKVSIASPSLSATDISGRDAAAAGFDFLRRLASAIAKRPAPAFWPAVSLCGALILWSAPALLLARYQPEQLFDALVRASTKPTATDLLSLSLVLLYVVMTGLLLGEAMGHLPLRGAPRVLLRLAMVPLFALSLATTMVLAVPLFLGTVICCFPNLI